jgi:hypothetical protein
VIACQSLDTGREHLLDDCAVGLAGLVDGALGVHADHAAGIGSGHAGLGCRFKAGNYVVGWQLFFGRLEKRG